MSIFDNIYESAVILREAKNFTSADEILNSIKSGKILDLINGKKNLPVWLKDDISNNKNIDEIKDIFNKVLEFLPKDANSGVNATIALLIKKSSSLDVMKEIINNSRDALIEYCNCSKSQWIKTIASVQIVEKEPYSTEVWHNMEKDLIDTRVKRQAKKHQTNDADKDNLYDTLYEDRFWGLYVPKSQLGDSELASHIKPFIDDDDNGEEKTYYKTRWCTAADISYYNSYCSDGNKYYIVKYFVDGVYTDAWQIAFCRKDHVEIMDKYDHRNFGFLLERAPDELLSKIKCDHKLRNCNLSLKDFKDTGLDYRDFNWFFSVDDLNTFNEYLTKDKSPSEMGYKSYIYENKVKAGIFDKDIISLSDFSSASSTEDCINYCNFIKKVGLDFKKVIPLYSYVYYGDDCCTRYCNFIKNTELSTGNIGPQDFYEKGEEKCSKYYDFIRNTGLYTENVNFANFCRCNDICINYYNFIKNKGISQQDITFDDFYSFGEEVVNSYFEFISNKNLSRESISIGAYNTIFKSGNLKKLDLLISKYNITNEVAIVTLYNDYSYSLSEEKLERYLSIMRANHLNYNDVDCLNPSTIIGYIDSDIPIIDFIKLRIKEPLLRNTSIYDVLDSLRASEFIDINKYLSLLKSSKTVDSNILPFKTFFESAESFDNEWLFYLNSVRENPTLKDQISCQDFEDLGSAGLKEFLKIIEAVGPFSNKDDLHTVLKLLHASVSSDDIIAHVSLINKSNYEKGHLDEFMSYDLNTIKDYLDIYNNMDDVIHEFSPYAYHGLYDEEKEFLKNFIAAKKQGRMTPFGRNIHQVRSLYRNCIAQDVNPTEFFNAVDNGEITIGSKWIDAVRTYKNEHSSVKQAISDIRNGILKGEEEYAASFAYFYDKYGRDEVIKYYDLLSKGAFDSTATLDQYIQYGAQNLNDINILKHQGRLWPTFTISDCFALGPDKALSISEEMLQKHFPKTATLMDYFGSYANKNVS